MTQEINHGEHGEFKRFCFAPCSPRLILPKECEACPTKKTNSRISLLSDG
jgi:hypothetical protein